MANAAYRSTHLKERRVYTAANREKIVAQEVRYYATNRERVRGIRAAWKKTNPEKNRASSRRHDALKRGATISDFTAVQWHEMQEHYAHRCAYCGKRSKGHLTQDHITPLSRGGNHTLSNIVPACRCCNSKKGKGPPLAPVQPLMLTWEERALAAGGKTDAE